MENKRYFFDRDESNHWYMIPYDKRGEWMQYLEDPEQIDTDSDKYREYMLSDDINKTSFENPESIVPEEKIEESVKNFDEYLKINK